MRAAEEWHTRKLKKKTRRRQHCTLNDKAQLQKKKSGNNNISNQVEKERKK